MRDEGDVAEASVRAEPPEVGGHVEVAVAVAVGAEAVVADVGDEHSPPRPLLHDPGAKFE